jgi:hypothetical protein
MSNHGKQNPLQILVFGWPEAFPDAGQHAGLLYRWHGADRIMFQYMFLQRLPVPLRTLLGEQEPGGQGRQAVGHSQATVS